MNSGFLLIILVALAGYLVQAKLRSVFSKYSKVTFPQGMTGKDVAEKMLADNGIHDVNVTSTPGSLTDHFNPMNKTVNLSKDVYNTCSISAAAVAAHECGHAVQHAKGYAPLKLRSALVPVVQISSSLSQIVIIAGILLMNIFPFLFWVGISMFMAVLLFSVITFPVELNASKRALAWLDNSGLVDSKQQSQAREALTWAASTYLVAVLSALATLIYYLGFARRN
ncbi:MAG: zinc metallopeptidase [Bacteroidetes bacterium]|nr:zinc metallopeptidase [Bacteroidota bacterium]